MMRDNILETDQNRKLQHLTTAEVELHLHILTPARQAPRDRNQLGHPGQLLLERDKLAERDDVDLPIKLEHPTVRLE